MAKAPRTNDELTPETNARRAAFLGLVFKNGWYVLPSRGGIVTNELIDKIQEVLDHEDAHLAGSERASGADG
jgi:hypothetical protein